MTSPDGITWTSRTSATDNQWRGVAYGDGLWVAVSLDGTGNRIMASSDGITWTSRTNPVDNGYVSIAYDDGLWVAVSFDGTGNRVMTSTFTNLTAGLLFYANNIPSNDLTVDYFITKG
jgi:hypothetical protein